MIGACWDGGRPWAGDAVRRTAGVTLAAASIVYVGWIAVDMTVADLWASLPFLLANTYLVALLFLTVHNNWHRLPSAVSAPAPFAEPLVAVLVPTYDEPPEG